MLSLQPDQHLFMLESLPDATVIANQFGLIVFVNKQTEMLFGFHREEMLGEHVEMLMPLRFRDSHVDKRQSFASSPRVRPMGSGKDLYGMRKDGSEFPVEIYLSPMQTENGLLILSSHRDISERKASETKIQHLNNELARSNAELEQFAAIASHDLQEPLRMITSYASLLEKKFGDKLDDKGRAYMDIVLDGAKRMRDLITAILNYSQVGHQGIKTEPVDSAAATRAAMANLEYKINAAQASVECGSLPVIVADPVLFVQLLQNLISNAIKFKSKECLPKIMITGDVENSEWIFSVSDNGIGIRPEDLKRIFTLFQRVHSTAEYPGTGIGLATCKKITERHGGRLWVESSINVGTTFFFSLPKS